MHSTNRHNLRKGKRVHLTAEGEALYDYAKKIFEYEKEIETAVEDIQSLKRGILRLGTTSAKSFMPSFMPSLMRKFHEKYPNVRIQVKQGTSQEIINSLIDFRNEVAIVAKLHDHPDVQFTFFYRVRLICVVSPDHPLAGKGELAFKDLAKELIIMTEKGSGTRQLVSELYVRNGCQPNILMETSNIDFIKQLVMQGEGISFLVEMAVTSELKEKRLEKVSIRNQDIYMDVQIAYLKNQPLSPPALAFFDILGKSPES